MNVDKKKLLNWGFYFVALLIVLEVFFRVVNYFDDTKVLVEEFISSNSDVINKTGAVKELTLKRRDVVDGNDRLPLYKQYFYFIEGNKSDAWVTVKVDNLKDKDNYTLSLTSVKE